MTITTACLVALTACIPTPPFASAPKPIPARAEAADPTTGLDVTLYLAAIPKPKPAPARVVRVKPARSRVAPRVAAEAGPATGDVWHRLAVCESGNRNDGGAPHFGYFQFSASTWRSMGMSGTADQHDYATQLDAAQRLQARSGWGQWPACSRKLGLR